VDGWKFEERKKLYIFTLCTLDWIVYTREYMSLPLSFGLVKLLSYVKFWGRWGRFHESTDYVLNTKNIALVNDVLFQ